MYVLESQWESDLAGFCKKLGIMFLKLKLASESGWPDRTLLYRGNVMILELKRAGEKPTPLQAYRLDQLRSKEFLAIWADDLDRVKKVILEWKQNVDSSRRSMA